MHHILNIIPETIKAQFPSSTQKEIVDVVKTWLVKAKHRLSRVTQHSSEEKLDGA